MENQNNNNADERPKLTRNTISDSKKMSIIEKSLQGNSVRGIANVMELPKSTINRIIKQWRDLGTYISRPKGGDMKSKLNDNNKVLIRSWIDDNPLLTLKELKVKVDEELNINVSLSTINRCIAGFHYSVKAIVKVPERRNCDSTLDQRVIYSRLFSVLLCDENIPDKYIIFIDEVGFSVSTRPSKRRALIGVSPYVNVTNARSRNISIVASMNKYGMIYYKIHDSAINGETFKLFLSELHAKCIDSEIENPIFIMDNAKIHHYRGLSETINRLQIQIEYLPPYSPFLNPIEKVFSVWKNKVNRGQARDEPHLKIMINTTFTEITPDQCGAFFRNMLGYLRKCEMRERILE